MKNSHLTLEDRQTIQEGLEKGLSRTQIAKNINKDISTVAKEIKNRRKLKPRNPFNNPITCTKFKECGICHGKCSEYEEIKSIEEIEKLGYVIFVLIFLNVDWTSISIVLDKLMMTIHIH